MGGTKLKVNKINLFRLEVCPSLQQGKGRTRTKRQQKDTTIYSTVPLKRF